MKRLLFSFTLLAAIAATSCATSNASNISAAGSEQSMTFNADNLTIFTTTLPVEVVITDSKSPRATVDIPSKQIAEWVVCRLHGSTLDIYQREGAGSRLASLSSDNPIKVRIESSSMTEISNTSSASVKCLNKLFGKSFTIQNTGNFVLTSDRIDIDKYFTIVNTGNLGFDLPAVNTGKDFEIRNTGNIVLDIGSIKASERIILTNTGRIECTTSTFGCKTWTYTNTGKTELSSGVTADEVLLRSTGLDDMSIDVNCKMLEVSSTGAGNISFTGRTDDVQVRSTGSARILTSELN